MVKTTETLFYAKRKFEFQKAQVKHLSNTKDSRYFEQLTILKDLENPYYLYSKHLPVTEDSWKNKYHNFLSNVVRSPFYNEELELLKDLE